MLPTIKIKIVMGLKTKAMPKQRKYKTKNKALLSPPVEKIKRKIRALSKKTPRYPSPPKVKKPFPPFLAEIIKYKTIKSPKSWTVKSLSGLFCQIKIAINEEIITKDCRKSFIIQ